MAGEHKVPDIQEVQKLLDETMPLRRLRIAVQLYRDELWRKYEAERNSDAAMAYASAIDLLDVLRREEGLA